MADGSLLMKHYLSCHRNSNILCINCFLVAKKEDIKLHKETYHKSLGYVCNVCSLRFEERKTLCEHFESTHVEEFTCNICHRTFKSRHEVERHMTYLHSCSFCQFVGPSMKFNGIHCEKTHKIKVICSFFSLNFIKDRIY